jgi:hypothetical protein
VYAQSIKCRRKTKQMEKYVGGKREENRSRKRQKQNTT